ncbi:MAG: ribonuclease HII [Flavobacteriaceae bacterium]
MNFKFCFILLLLVISCKNSNNTKKTVIDFIPKNASIIIKTSNLDDLKSSIKNSDFLQQLSKTDSYKNVNNTLKNLSLIHPKDDVLICFSEENDSLHYALITKYHKGLFKIDSTLNIKEEKLSIKNNNVAKTTLNKQILYSTVVDSVFFASTSRHLINAVFEDTPINEDFSKIYHTTNNNRTFSVFVKAKTPFITSVFPDAEALPLKSFTKYLAIDVDVNQNKILLNGIAKANDSTQSLVNVFKGNTPQVNQLQHIAPFNCDGFLSFTFNDFEKLQERLETFNKTDSVISAPLFSNSAEVGVIFQDKDRAVVLNSLDNIATEAALIANRTITQTFRETPIYGFSTPDLFSSVFYPLISFKEASSYCVLDNYFVFSNNTELLQSIITNYQNRTTLANAEPYKNIKKELSDASSILLVANPSTLKQIININVKDTLDVNLQAYNISAFQFVFDTHFAHVNGIIEKNKSKANNTTITEELNIKLSADLLSTPQFVTNHITKENEIVIQDVNNNLYLISNKGKILWKKPLEAPVLGQINQMDIYKNGRLQLVFATPHNLYVIDRNGNEVKPFPKKFNDAITQPLALFDYDNNKNYRLLVTQDKNALMYDAKGNTVKGFTFKTAENNIITPPQHFRIGSKDYLVLKTADKLYILDRTGRVRVTPKQNHNYSAQPVFAYNDTFTTTTAMGDLILVDAKGNVSSKNLNLTKNHGITTSSKTLATLNGNTLVINNKTVELDFGNYTAPKLFIVNNKIYISATDLQAQKIYMFDSQAQPLPNFPVYGTSAIDLNRTKNSLEFVAKGENNSVLLYKLN